MHMQRERHDECLISFSHQPISEMSITITSPIFSLPIAESPVKKMGLVSYKKKRSVFYDCDFLQVYHERVIAELFPLRSSVAPDGICGTSGDRRTVLSCSFLFCSLS